MRTLRSILLVVGLLWVLAASPAVAGFTLSKTSPAQPARFPLVGAELEETRGGVKILNFTAGSPASLAGFVVGDILTSVNGAEVFGETSLKRAIFAARRWDIVLVRGGGVFGATIAETDLAPSVTEGTKAKTVSWTKAAETEGVAALQATVASVGARKPTGPRVALIIANSAYDASLGRLSNPLNDAKRMGDALRVAGFDVEVLTDADQKTMKRAIARLGERVHQGGKGATGLFFYAGHGIQTRGVNYLVPIGALLESEADVDLEAVPADAVMRQLEEAGAQTSIVILDACRNLPLARAYRDATRGLARMDAPVGSFISYSTAPGGVAADGVGETSPFVAALSRELLSPGQSIEATFRKVRIEVRQATKGRQTPWEASSLVQDFQFVP